MLNTTPSAEKRVVSPVTGKLFVLVALVLAGFLFSSESHAQTVSLNVQGPDSEPVFGFRWLLEEDLTYRAVPGQPNPDSLAFNFHASYMPVAASGNVVGSSTLIPVDPSKRYFLSVLPNGGYSMSGGGIEPGQTTLTVTVSKHPIPTAQISIFVFEDNQPINNIPDLPEEQGLEGFSIILEDAAGRYGQSGGHAIMDVFGNPLGTTYNPDGSVLTMGTGEVLTDANGEALIKNLAPGKYGVVIVPPPGTDWQQTSTIEGSPVIDAWVKAKEPAYFMEFGPPGYHVFVGFVKPFKDTEILSGGVEISGRVVNLHQSRPPDATFYPSEPIAHSRPWIGLNDLSVGTGEGVIAFRAEPDATFTISDVPPGTYQLVIWDDFLDFIFAFKNVTVEPGGGNIDLGDIPVFQWFFRLENHVFYDANENGFRDPGEAGIPEMGINIRWRDGTLYQAFPTDLDGYVPFDQVFPFFHWLVAEVDFTRFKATGVTITVDNGGPVNPNDPFSFGGQLKPQLQPENGNQPFRTETGPVLTQAFQGFLGQTSVLEWGKANYTPGDNGGISGMVFYAVTRAEDDPAYAAAEEWEPGIPRVVVNLYEDKDHDEVIDDLDGDNQPTLSDVDNYPFENFPGPEDIDRNGNGQFDHGDAVQITTTDSWDDNLPADCPGDPLDPFYLGGKGYDGMRIWNQVRPGVFDGGYAFASYFPGGMGSGSSETSPLPTGTYIVEVVPPRNAAGESVYEVIKEEDRNVDFGDDFTSNFQALPPACVGDPHLVPAELTLFPGVPAPYAGEMRPPGRPQADQAQRAAERRGGFLPLHPGSPRGPRGGLRAERSGQRIRPQVAPVRREVRASLDPRVLPRLDGQGGHAGLHGRARPVQRPGPLDLHHEPGHAQRRVAEHAHGMHQRSGSHRGSGQSRPVHHRSLLQPAVQRLLLHLPVHGGHHHLPGHAGAAHRGLRRTGRLSPGLRARGRDPADLPGGRPRWRPLRVRHGPDLDAHRHGNHRGAQSLLRGL